MPRRSGADITFLLDRLDERRNRYLLPPLPLRFRPLSILLCNVPTALERSRHRRFKERKSFPPFQFAFARGKIQLSPIPRVEKFEFIAN